MKGWCLAKKGDLEAAVYCDYPRLCFRRSYSAMRVIRVEWLLGEFLVYNYTLEYVTTYLLEESLENRIRLLERYSILYIQVLLAAEYSKG